MITVPSTDLELLEGDNILMHKSFVTTPPPPPPPPPPSPKGGQGIELCFYFSIVPAVQRKYQGFVLYRQTWQCNENLTDCGGKRLWCPRSEGLLAGICRTKVPAIPGDCRGPWLQMTCALSESEWFNTIDNHSSWTVTGVNQSP